MFYSDIRYSILLHSTEKFPRLFGDSSTNSQFESLKNLNLVGIFIIDVVKTAFKMENLQTFVVPNLTLLNWPTLEFSINKNLRVLDISSIDIRNEELVRAFMKSSPNVTNLRIQSLSKKIALMMNTNLCLLRNVSVTSQKNLSIQKYFPHINWQMDL